MSRVRVIRGWRQLQPSDGAAVAMGNFDGVHRGHQAVIALAAEAARRLGAPLGVLTFDPHPRDYFQPGEPPFRLMRADQQARILESLGVDILYVLPLDPELVGMTDREYAIRVLANGLGVRHVSVGFDNTYGKGRSGTPQTLRDQGAELGFSVSIADPVSGPQGQKISSTAAREAIQQGRPDEATTILGRPFAIEGAVQRGRQMGRKLGFPTANVALADYITPRFGVYATRTRLPDGREVAGVASIGTNPTVGEVAALLEVWLFDFDEDIYDQVIETDLIAFLRREEKFPSLDLMTEQVMRDAAQARALLLPDLG
jgi:riboflavin kinase/FMN adenylyltransferase